MKFIKSIQTRLIASVVLFIVCAFFAGYLFGTGAEFASLIFFCIGMGSFLFIAPNNRELMRIEQ